MPIQLLLPVEIEGKLANEALKATGQELADSFDGLTAYTRSPAKGIPTAPEGHTEQEAVAMFEVVTESFDKSWWQRYTETLSSRFKQKSIHLRALTIEMLDDQGR